MIVLGIETSCDETAASVVRYDRKKIEILSNIVSSQVKLHAKYGGVVPNLAAREHLKNIIPVLDMAFEKSGISPEDIDLISVTNGPGLIPALLIGTNCAKTLSYVWDKPLIGIHHIEGHIYANFLKSQIANRKSNDRRSAIRDPRFPVLALVVSGGHTQLILMKNHLKYEIIGQTLDDAAGEAFDKVARILNIGYPGGPLISRLAEKYESKDRYAIKLPRPMINSNNFDFSFSGLKTAVLYRAKNDEKFLKDEKYINEMCHEFQQAVIDVLISKTIKAAKKYNPKAIMLAGGVSANTELRKQLGEKIKNEFPKVSYMTPDIAYTGDNATMVAIAACFRWQKMSASQKKKTLQNWKTLDTDANLKLK